MDRTKSQSQRQPQNEIWEEEEDINPFVGREDPNTPT